MVLSLEKSGLLALNCQELNDLGFFFVFFMHNVRPVG